MAEDVFWLNVRTNYELAKKYLWCPKHANEWHRDEVNGMYHLWTAYNIAVTSTLKENLTYARVLVMMSDEQHNVDSYTRFHQYIAPAMEAYDRAKAAGKFPTEKEYAKAKRSYDALKYKLDKTSGTEEQYEAAYALIEGMDAVPDFCFHDSKPVYFEQTADRAILKLQFHEITVTLEFSEIVDFTAEGDPLTNWINDFYCYPSFHNPELIRFDVGYYRIDCKAIRVIDVQRGQIEET